MGGGGIWNLRDQSWGCICHLCIFLVATKKISSDLESPHFLTFSAKCRKFKIGERDGHGKSRNGPEIIDCNTCAHSKRDSDSVSCRPSYWYIVFHLGK